MLRISIADLSCQLADKGLFAEVIQIQILLTYPRQSNYIRRGAGVALPVVPLGKSVSYGISIPMTFIAGTMERRSHEGKSILLDSVQEPISSDSWI